MRKLFFPFFAFIAAATLTLPAQAGNLADSVSSYQNRYHLDDVFEKRVDNRGEGFQDLYGTRNFRAVLNGIVYRGGANNKYHHTKPRSNSNPLPNDGLTNLCEEGFGTSVYLYTENYNSAPKITSCRTHAGDNNSLPYKQQSVLSSTSARDAVLQLVYQKITGTDHRPIYMHCWNGWHASGYISALVLRQFCGWSGSKAVAYWDRNTDGNNTESGFEGIRNRIRNFAPSPNLKISAATQELVCPK